MADETKSRVQVQFGAAAADYATSEVHAKGESLELLMKLVKARPEWRVLDVATGAGHTALAFAPHVREVVALDWTPQMLQQGARLASERGLQNLTFVQGDAEKLPFPDASFDLLTCRLAFHHFPHPEQALAEFARVVRPGGFVGFTDNISVPDPEGREVYNRFEKIRDPSHHWVDSLPNLIERFEAAGLSVLASQEISKEFEFEDWADRQRASPEAKVELQKILKSIPKSLGLLLAPRWESGVSYFTLWEALILAQKGA